MTLVAFCKHCGKTILPTFDEKGRLIDWSCPDCGPRPRPVGSARCPECGTDCLHIIKEDRSALCFWCGYESPPLTGEPTTEYCTDCGRMAHHVARPGPLAVILVREGWRDTDAGWMCPSCLLRRIGEEEP